MAGDLHAVAAHQALSQVGGHLDATEDGERMHRAGAGVEADFQASLLVHLSADADRLEGHWW